MQLAILATEWVYTEVWANELCSVKTDAITSKVTIGMMTVV